MARRSKLKGQLTVVHAAGKCAAVAVTAMSLLAPSAQTLA